jgi:hypothetical protein
MPPLANAPSLGNKTVVVVGPAPYVEGVAGLVSVVAFADVVARPNVRVDPSQKALVLPENTTSRVDIVFHHGALEDEPLRASGKADAWSSLGLSQAKAYAAAGVRLLVLAEATHKQRCWHFEKLRHLLRGESNTPSIQLRSLLAPPATLHGCSRGRDEHVHHRTGVKMITDILQHRPRHLVVFGFTFYDASDGGNASAPRTLSRTHRHQNGSTWSSGSRAGRGGTEPSMHGFRGYYSESVPAPETVDGWHDTDAELRYFACLLLSTTAPISIDGHLKRILVKRAAARPEALSRLRPTPFLLGRDGAAEPIIPITLYTAWRAPARHGTGDTPRRAIV